MKSTLRRRLTVMLLCTLLLVWAVAFALQQYATLREQTGVRDRIMRYGASYLLTSMPLSLLDGNALAGRFTLQDEGLLDIEKARLQVWSLPDRKLLLHSSLAAGAPMIADFRDGFSDRDIDGGRWRVYGLTDSSGRLQVQFAKSDQDLRDDLLRDLQRGLGFFAILFLVLAVATWCVIRRAFLPVDQARDALSRRTSLDLTPLPLAAMPGELQPFVASINHQLERLQNAMERERRFVADAAHELRTPLAALGMHIERMSDGGAAPDGLAALRETVARTARLAGQLLDQARMDACGDAGNALVPVRLDEVVAMLVRDSEMAAHQRRQRIRLALQPSVVEGDVDGLGILVRNLLDNAVRYTPEGGCIDVACQSDAAGGVSLSVADDGPGIAPADRARVFDRFYRIAGQASHGCGIGLSLVAQVARQHGASIRIETGLAGRGVAMVVDFPAPRGSDAGRAAVPS